MMQLYEIALINRILEGDIRGYAILVEKYKDLAFTIAYRLLSNREDAEEVVQDAFVKAYRSLSGFRKDSRFSTWLFRIVYNASISKLRGKKTGLRSLDEQPALQDDLYHLDYEEDTDEEKKILLERAMQQLSEEERTLITLFYMHESSVEEIHSITGLTKSNIKVKLFRARKKLQELVGFVSEKAFI